MNLTRDRVHSIGWVSVLLICAALAIALTLRVNAVKSQVHDVEKGIVYVQRDIDFLETEFQTRSNQQALSQLNELEFGYKAPGAAQYIEGERQLAAFGKAALPGAPEPIRYANAEKPGREEEKNSLLAMVSPVTGATAAVPEQEEKRPAAPRGRDPERAELARDAASLGKRLAHIELAEAAQQ